MPGTVSPDGFQRSGPLNSKVIQSAILILFHERQIPARQRRAAPLQYHRPFRVLLRLGQK